MRTSVGDDIVALMRIGFSDRYRIIADAERAALDAAGKVIYGAKEAVGEG